MPEPSWFPNTVGIGLSAVKTWLYFPMCGHLLMAVRTNSPFLLAPTFNSFPFVIDFAFFELLFLSH